MTLETDYVQEYGRVQKAYLQGNYEEAATTIDRMAQKFPKDPNVLLLRANIYCNGLGQYELAKEQYESVLALTNEPELVNFANNGLRQVLKYQNNSKSKTSDPNSSDRETSASKEVGSHQTASVADKQNGSGISKSEFSIGGDEGELESPEKLNTEEVGEEILEDWQLEKFNPFTDNTERNLAINSKKQSVSNRDDNLFGDVKMQEKSLDWQKRQQENSSEFPFLDMDINEKNEQGINELQENEDSTFVVFSDIHELRPSEEGFEDDMTGMQDDYDTYDEEEDQKTELSFGKNYQKREYSNNRNQFSSDDDFEEFDEIDSHLHEDGFSPEQGGYGEERASSNQQASGNKNFLEEFDVFDDNNLKNFSNFELGNAQSQQSDSELFDRQIETMGAKSLNLETEGSSGSIAQQGMLSLNQPGDIVPSNFANQSEAALVESPSEIEQGPLGAFKNSSLTEKQWIAAGAAGIVSAIAVAVVGITASGNNAQNVAVSQVGKVGALMTVAAGAASFGTSMFFGAIATNQVKRSTFDLQKQFELLYQGNYNAKATVYSKDEFGQLAAKFNQMAQAISTTTEEAERRAKDTEQAREDLQRQVIRLLDDVEGAARGDLTVQAEVTADVLGAVADAFNLTIQNLREIVKQVKQAAQQVNKGATDSESFARNQYNNALAMAGELAVTLNSVQMMTDSIQRVAENAREAEEVARSSAVTALKGGESVERTVAGILEIRETVSETARKVKRLAEASQEISKIVAIIGQISSRTNLLALNASIEAARAGESGRGFAIVADEVRQLADKSAKSLKEIEQIVWQIQTETGSVMEAMEEGLQQVLDVTERAEQAKGSLEDIIQVSNRIDALVRSITASTVEQRENSRAVSEVMQSVELTAQATSRESQRVAGALQNLVSISQELLSSVERFRVDPNEEM